MKTLCPWSRNLQPEGTHSQRSCRESFLRPSKHQLLPTRNRVTRGFPAVENNFQRTPNTSTLSTSESLSEDGANSTTTTWTSSSATFAERDIARWVHLEWIIKQVQIVINFRHRLPSNAANHWRIMGLSLLPKLQILTLSRSYWSNELSSIVLEASTPMRTGFSSVAIEVFSFYELT